MRNCHMGSLQPGQWPRIVRTANEQPYTQEAQAHLHVTASGGAFRRLTGIRVRDGHGGTSRGAPPLSASSGSDKRSRPVALQRARSRRRALVVVLSIVPDPSTTPSTPSAAL